MLWHRSFFNLTCKEKERKKEKEKRRDNEMRMINTNVQCDGGFILHLFLLIADN